MTIYLDAHVVQSYADCEKFMFGESDEVPETHRSVEPELRALRQLMELDDLTHWCYAAPRHLLDELHRGRPTEVQKRTYAALVAGWDLAGDEAPTENDVGHVEASLQTLRLKDDADCRHLAEAVALGASWFLTNDRELIQKARGRVPGLKIGRPSECVDDMSRGLFMK